MSSNKGVIIETRAGRRTVALDAVAKLGGELKATVLVAPADELPHSMKRGKHHNAVKRTDEWLGSLLKAAPAHVSVFGSIVGGVYEDMRGDSAKVHPSTHSRDAPLSGSNHQLTHPLP